MANDSFISALAVFYSTARLPEFSHQLEGSWPLLTSAMAIAWIFVRIASKYLGHYLLRWAVAGTILIAVLIPIGPLSLSAWLLPFIGPLSGLTFVLLLASMHHGPEKLLPKFSWLIISVLCLLRMLDSFGLWPVSLTSLAYLANVSFGSLITVSCVLLALLGSMAVRRPLLAFFALVPALLWRLDWAPFQDLWNAYTDLPLMMASLIALFRPDRGGKKQP